MIEIPPTVSVVIPHFNSKNTIERAISSISEQTRVPDEVIVIDDASTQEDSILLLRGLNLKYPKLNLRLIFLEINSGPGKARNIGIRESKSSHIAFLDSDDWWLPRHLEVAVTLIQNFDNRSQVIVSSQPLIKGQKCLARDIQDEAVTPVVKRMNFFRMFLFQRNYHTISLVVPKIELLKTSLFVEDRRHAEDLELFFKLYLSGTPWVYLSNISTAVLGKEAFSSGRGLSSNLIAMHLGTIASLRNSLIGTSRAKYIPFLIFWFRFKFFRRVFVTSLRSSIEN